MRAGLSFVVGLVALAACASFDADPSAPTADAGATPDAGPSGTDGDGGTAVDADANAACTRARFTDAFERGDLGNAGWDQIPTGPAPENLDVDIDDEVGSESAHSLRVETAQRPSGVSRYLQKAIVDASCPVSVRFDLLVADIPRLDGAHVTFASVQLSGGAALLLRLDRVGLQLSEQLGPEAESVPLGSMPLATWTTFQLRYDPTMSPPTVQVRVGNAPETRYVAKLPLGPPAALRIGAAYVTLDAEVALWIDDVVIE